MEREQEADMRARLTGTANSMTPSGLSLQSGARERRRPDVGEKHRAPKWRAGTHRTSEDMDEVGDVFVSSGYEVFQQQADVEGIPGFGSADLLEDLF